MDAGLAVARHAIGEQHTFTNGRISASMCSHEVEGMRPPGQIEALVNQVQASDFVPGSTEVSPSCQSIHGDIVTLLEAVRRAAARSVNALMTATYWQVGQRPYRR